MIAFLRRFMLFFLGLLSTVIINPASAPTVHSQSAPDTWSIAPLVGGNVRALVIDPTTPTTLYAAAGLSVFRTTNSGGNWEPVLTSGNEMSAIAIDSSTIPGTLYAASKKQVWRSSNNGTNWTEISSGLTADVEVLKLSPVNQQLWAGTRNGVWRYTSSWEARGSGPVTVMALALSETTIYAGTYLGLFRSFDNGANWQYTPTPEGSNPGSASNDVRSIVINPNDSQTVVIGTTFGGIYISDNGGSRWTKKPQAAPEYNISFLNFTDLAYVQSDFPNEPPILYASTDSQGADGQPIPNQGLFPRSGVFYLEDNAVWRPAFDGLWNKYVTRLAAHPTLPGTLYAGTQGSGVWVKTGTTSAWVQQSSGLTALAVKTLARTGNTLYAGTTGDGIYRSNDNGTTWTRLGQGLPLIETRVESLLVDEFGVAWLGHSRYGLFRLAGDTWIEVSKPTFGFTNVTALASNSRGIIAAYQINHTSTRSVVFSEDRGNNWQQITTGLPSNVLIYHFASQVTGNGTIIWASTENGLYRLAPDGEQWELVGTSSGLTMGSVRYTVVDPNNTNILYAVGSSVFKSLNGGADWSERGDNLIGGPFSGIALDPTNAQLIYLAGNSNILKFNIATGSWVPLGSNGPLIGQSVIVSPTGVVYVGTPNGLWRFVPNGSIPPPNPKRTVWGILIYLNGDNDLDPVMEDVFDRLEQVANNPAVCIDVLWDRSNGPPREYIVQPDTVLGSTASTYVLNQTYWQYGELDMGAQATLETFIPRARVRCPADYYWVSIVDHGGGWAPQALPDLATRGKYKIGSGGGISWDDTSGGHRMGTQELQLALKNATVDAAPIDVLFYDACLMGMFEDAYAARQSARYLVGSSNIAWGIFPYHEYIQSITTSTSPRQLAENIVSIYGQALSTEPYTMAAYDLAQTEQAASSLKVLAKAIRDQISNDSSSSAKIKSFFKDMQKYDTSNNDALDEQDTSVDLADLTTRLIATFPATDVAIAAAEIRGRLLSGPTPLIIKSVKQSSSPEDKTQYDHTNATGMGIYFPLGLDDRRKYIVYTAQNGQIELSNTTTWGETIKKLRDSLPALPPEQDIDLPRYSPKLFQRPWIYLPQIMR